MCVWVRSGFKRRKGEERERKWIVKEKGENIEKKGKKEWVIILAAIPK